jgi:hypothetical protein
MGGVRGSGAFSKGSEDAALLDSTFINGKLALTAEPNNVITLFPSLKEKSTSQIRSGFNRIRDNAKEALSAMTQTEKGKKKCF